MKITQDASVFGGIVKVDGAKTILDIGSGSGILTLMMAQKSDAKISALDIEEGAIQQTKVNIQNAPFENEFEVLHQDVKELKDRKFDLIISNPPYYTDQDQASNKEYNLARHSNASLNFDDLAESVDRLLTQNGKFWFILPIYEYQKLLKSLEVKELYPNYLLGVRHNSNAKNARIIASISREKIDQPVQENLFIRELDNNYTVAFKELLEDYYIKF